MLYAAYHLQKSLIGILCHRMLRMRLSRLADLTVFFINLNLIKLKATTKIQG